MMRGYRVLKATGRLDLMTEIGEAMTNAPFHHGAANVSPLIFGAGVDRADAIIRQYVLYRLTGFTLNQALLASLGQRAAVVHPLPAPWRAVLERQGFAVGRMRSALAWQGYVFLMWGYGVLSIVLKVMANLKAVRHSATGKPLGRYAYFQSLAIDNLPQSASDGCSYDIVTWYEQWPGRASGLNSLCHSVAGAPPSTANGIPVRATASVLPPLSRWGSHVRFLAWGLAATALAAADMLRGRWWHALLLSQASSAAVARMLPSGYLAQDYLFHVMGCIFRPMWTYEAERRGSRVILYNYSTGIETFKRSEGYPTQANSWHAMTWPICLVWDEGQADFFRRAVGDRADIRVVGPIWFSTSSKEMPPWSNTAAVAVFDVQPKRPSRYQLLGAPDEFLTPRTLNQFVLDIHTAIQDAGGLMVLKRKPKTARLVHRAYAALVSRLGDSSHFLAIDPEIAAPRVIERCHAVISLPFTSTALLGRAMGKPSIYYDPHGIVQKDDRAAHGIPILTGADELNAWVAAHVGCSASVEQPVAR